MVVCSKCGKWCPIMCYSGDIVTCIDCVQKEESRKEKKEKRKSLFSFLKAK